MSANEKNTKSKILQIQHSMGFSPHNVEDRTFRTGIDPITKNKKTKKQKKNILKKKQPTTVNEHYLHFCPLSGLLSLKG